MSEISDELREWAAAQCNSLALYKLADLIDPTCHMEDVDTEPGGYQGTGLCSECGELLIPRMRFCPNCGARVTSGGETGND